MKCVDGTFIGSMLLCAIAGVTQASQPGPQTTAPPSTWDQDQKQQKPRGQLEVLTDTQGVNFGPYLDKVISTVRSNWYLLIPEEARPPQLKKGKVAIQFAIVPDGKVVGITVSTPSGDVPMDRAAWGAIVASAPFDHLPQQFRGPYLGLRFHFYYNPAKSDLASGPTTPQGGTINPAPK